MSVFSWSHNKKGDILVGLMGSPVYKYILPQDMYDSLKVFDKQSSLDQRGVLIDCSNWLIRGLRAYNTQEWTHPMQYLSCIPFQNFKSFLWQLYSTIYEHKRVFSLQAATAAFSSYASFFLMAWCKLSVFAWIACSIYIDLICKSSNFLIYSAIMFSFAVSLSAILSAIANWILWFCSAISCCTLICSLEVLVTVSRTLWLFCFDLFT